MLYLILALTCFFFSLQFICNKYYQVRTDSSVNAGVWLTAIYSVLTIACFAYSGLGNVSSGVFWIAAGYSVCFIAVIIFGVPALKLGSVSTYTMFTLTGSITVTFLYGVIVLKEALGVGKLVGFLLILSSLFPSVIGDMKRGGGIIRSRRQKLLYVAICAVVFVGNGLFGVFVKLAALHADEIDNSRFLLLTGIIRAALALIILLIIRFTAKKPRSVLTGVGKKNLTPATLSGTGAKSAFISFLIACAAGLSYAVCNLAGNYFSIELAALMDSSSQFPIVCATVLVLSAVISAVFLKEKPTKQTYISLGLALFGIGTYLLPF